MGLDDKASRDILGEVACTAGHIKHPLAIVALKVVVVLVVGPLVAGALARDLDSGEVAAFGERLDGTVDGGDAQVGQRLLRLF